MGPAFSERHPIEGLVPKPAGAAECAAMRDILRSCAFNSESVTRRLGIPDLTHFQHLRNGRQTVRSAEQPLDALILMFLDGEYLERKLLEALLPPGAFAAMEALGIADHEPEWPELCFATCLLFPAMDLLLASDRASGPDGRPYTAPADAVYPAIVPNTRDFLAALPRTPCETFLELGTGTGVAALDASRYAGKVWATDITARAVRYAEFNRRLNGIGNVTVLEGDLYQPVSGLTFDRIVMHPPYVPARRNRMIYRDGGEDGEQILRRAIEDLPRMLRPGGKLYTFVTAADCEGQALEERVRLWLGPQGAGFDIVLVSHKLTPPKDVLANMMARGNTPMEDWQYQKEIWARRKVQFLFYGTILIRRPEVARPGINARVQTGEGFGPRHAEWLLEWETAAHDPAERERLMESRPSLSPHAELGVLHRVREGRFVAESFSVRANSPFEAECVCEEWLAGVISQCDGRTTWRQLWERSREAGFIHPGTSAEEFLEVLEPLVGNALLRIPELPCPESGA